jgi:hypothetical protein
VILFTAVFMVATDTNRSTNIVAAVQSAAPRSTSGLQSNDKIVRIAGKPSTRDDGPADPRDHGRAFTLVVRRDGKLVALGPFTHGSITAPTGSGSRSRASSAPAPRCRTRR